MMRATLYILPLFVCGIIGCALLRKVNAYASFVQGAKDGLRLFFEIYPALLAMMFSIAMLKESGVMEQIGTFFEHLLPAIPSQIWPMVLFRPISGNASLAVLADIFTQCGVDSLPGMMASILQGSTDTTFYVITLYFSSVGIRHIKNALSIGLLADAAGMTMAILLTLLFFT